MLHTRLVINSLFVAETDGLWVDVSVQPCFVWRGDSRC